jgi:hypothetical protein
MKEKHVMKPMHLLPTFFVELGNGPFVPKSVVCSKGHAVLQ